MLGVAPHLSPITGSGWDFFVWLWEEQILASEEHMHPQRTVVPGTAAGEGAAFNKQGYGISLGVARSGLFCEVCVTHL